MEERLSDNIITPIGDPIARTMIGPVMLVLGLGLVAQVLVLVLGLGIQVLGLGLSLDSVGQMLSCYTRVYYVHNSTTSMTVTLLVYLY